VDSAGTFTIVVRSTRDVTYETLPISVFSARRWLERCGRRGTGAAHTDTIDGVRRERTPRRPFPTRPPPNCRRTGKTASCAASTSPEAL